MERTGRVSYREQHYLTTFELAMELRMHPGSLSRWVKLWNHADGASVTLERKGGAYRMPITYRLVGRGWTLTQDDEVREVMLKILPSDPKPWLIVVGKVGYTCYTSQQTGEKVLELLKTKEAANLVIHIFNLGNYKEG